MSGFFAGNGIDETAFGMPEGELLGAPATPPVFLGPCSPLSPAWLYYPLGGGVHLLPPRGARQQEQVHAGGLERLDAVEYLLWRADQPAPQTAVGDGVIFQRDALFELRAGQPLLVVVVPGRGLLHVGDAG